jgi:hypothetical protein
LEFIGHVCRRVGRGCSLTPCAPRQRGKAHRLRVAVFFIWPLPATRRAFWLVRFPPQSCKKSWKK